MGSTVCQLSPKHEAFAVFCAGGTAAGAAYARVYPKASKATAETNGPALLRKAQVKARVAELQGKVETEFTLRRAEWLEFYLRLAKAAEDAGDFGAARGCLREIGLAMRGWYAPDKVEAELTLDPEVMAAFKRRFSRERHV